MSNIETPIPIFKKVSVVEEVTQFIDYVNSFYNIETGIYPIATYDEIVEAVGEFIKTPTDIPIEFDSLDRERVRKIIQPEYTIF